MGRKKIISLLIRSDVVFSPKIFPRLLEKSKNTMPCCIYPIYEGENKILAKSKLLNFYLLSLEEKLESLLTTFFLLNQEIINKTAPFHNGAG